MPRSSQLYRDERVLGQSGSGITIVHSTQEGHGFPRLQLLGLDPKATYALSSIEGKAAEGTPAEASGAWWMNHGIEVALQGDFQGAAFRLDRK